MTLLSGLVAYYKLDGNSNDSIGSRNGADTSISYSTGNGKINQGAGFNGTSSHIDTSSVILTATDNFTIAAWIKPSSFPQLSIAVQNGTDNGGAGGNNGYGFGLGDGLGGSGNKLQGLLSGVAWADSGYYFLNTNIWYHVVMVRTSGTLNFYVNGTITSGSNTSTPATPTTLSQIGSQVGIRFFNGKIDEVGFWNRALSSTEITQLYNGGAGLSYPFLSGASFLYSMI